MIDGRLKSPMELLRERARQTSLMDGVQPSSPAGVPGGLLGPTPPPASIQQLAGSAQLRPAPAMPGPTPPPGGTRQGLRARSQAQQSGQVFAATMLRDVAGVQDFKPATRAYIQEVATEGADTGPGRKGRGFFARLAAGEKVPGLTDAQNERIGRTAMLMSGLAILGSDETGLQAVADGLLFGQAYALGLAQNMLAATETEGQRVDLENAQTWARTEYMRIHDSNPEMPELQKWAEVSRRATLEGQNQAADFAATLADRFKGFESGTAERRFEVVNGTPVFVDTEAGKVFDIQGNEIDAEELAPQREPVRPIVRTRQLPDGTEVSFLADPFTGEPVPGSEEVAGRPEPEGPAEPKPAQIQAAGTARSMRAELATLQDVLERGNPGRIERLKPNEFKSEDAQRFEAAANAIAGIALKARSGATATEQEFGRIVSENIPRPGDSQKVIDEKIARINRAIANLEAQATGQLPASDVDAELDEIFGAGGGQ